MINSASQICTSMVSQKKNVVRILPLAILLLATAQQYAQLPRTDTVSQRMNTDTSSWQYKKELSDFRKLILEQYLLKNTSSWQYKMEQSDDKWSGMERKKDFQLFYRYNYGPPWKKSTYRQHKFLW